MEWKEINGFEGLYEINLAGQIRSVKSGKLKTIFQRGDVKRKSPHVGLNKNGKTQTFKVDRLLYDTFGITNQESDFMEGEIWKPIIGYEGCYEVSNKGRVKSLDRYIQQFDNRGNLIDRFIRGRILSTNRNNGSGYLTVQLRNGVLKENTGNDYIHILVAKHFVKNLENKPTVNHKDGNKKNNSAENLEWATQSEQMKHAYENGLNVPPEPVKWQGEESPSSKLKEYQVIEIIKKLHSCKDSELSKAYGVSRKTISNIRHNVTWNYIDRRVHIERK